MIFQKIFNQYPQVEIDVNQTIKNGVKSPARFTIRVTQSKYSTDFIVIDPETIPVIITALQETAKKYL